MEAAGPVVVLEAEALLAPVPVRAEVRESAPVEEPLAVVPGSAVGAGVPVVYSVAMVQAGTSVMLQVVALAAVDLVGVVPLVLQVIVPAMHLVAEMALMPQVIVAALVLEMPFVVQVVVPLVLQVPVMPKMTVVLDMPLVLQVVVAAVMMPDVVPVVDAMPMMGVVAAMVTPLQCPADPRPGRRGEPVASVVMMPARVMTVVRPGHGTPPALLAGVGGEHLQCVRP